MSYKDFRPGDRIVFSNNNFPCPEDFSGIHVVTSSGGWYSWAIVNIWSKDETYALPPTTKYFRLASNRPKYFNK